MPLAKETFVVSHSLVSNKLPKRLSLTELDALKYDRKVDMERFGLFDISSPDFSKYYPEVKPEDLLPSDEDFVYPIFRALSKVIVNKYGPVDFSKGTILKDSLSKLIGQSIYPNHDTNVGNELGVILEAFWQESFKQGNVKIPAGINVRLKIDGKCNPKLTRGVMMEPPSVHSCSVGITFMWEKSHPDMEDSEFWQKLGSYDKEGVLIRRVVTEIIGYNELSLVNHGADPYAQKVSEGGKGINNPEYAKSRDNMFSEDDYKTLPHFMDWKEPMSSFINLSEDDSPATIPSIPNQTPHQWNFNKPNQSTMKKEVLNFLIAQFGLAADSTEESVLNLLQQKLPGLVQSASQLSAAQSELSQLKAKYPEGTLVLNAEQTQKLAKYDELLAQSTARLAEVRAEALKNYNLAMGTPEKADPSITKLISESSLENAIALNKQYSAMAESNFKLTCQDCNSTNVKRNSALGAGKTEGEQSETPPTAKTSAEVREELARKAKSTNVDFVHGKLEKKNP